MKVKITSTTTSTPNLTPASSFVDLELQEKDASHGNVYFIRHGESTANEANVYSGVTDVPLTRFGIRQAQAAGVDMRNKEIDRLDAIYTSHLVRTRQTAATALYHAGLVPHDDPERVDEWPVVPQAMPCLAERSFGVFTGENKVLLRRALGHEEFEHMVHSSDDAPPCAETMGSIYRRVQDFHCQEILPRLARGENVLVVAHQYVLEAYALVLEDLPPSEYYSFSLPNGKALSIDEMKAYRYKTTSPTQKKIDEVGDKIVLHGTKLAAILFLVGMVARALPGLWNDPWISPHLGPIFQATVTFCLAVSSWFVYLEIDLGNALANTDRGDSLIVLVVYLIRMGILATGTLWILQDTNSLSADMYESAQYWALLWALPPALTTPTISLTWGGRVYLTAIGSSVLSVICGLVLNGLALSPWLGFNPVDLVPFLVVLIVALLIPACAAQAYRACKPIDSKRYSKKWKFLGVVAFAVMGLVAGFYLTPANLLADLFQEDNLMTGQSHNCIRQFQIAFLVYLGMRVTAFVAARLAMVLKSSDDQKSANPGALPSPAKEYLNVDVLILLSQHNIFLWIALLSSFRDYTDTRGAGIYAAFWATTFFFMLPALEEKVLVGILARRLLKAGLSRTVVRAKEEELNAVWKETAERFVEKGQVMDFYRD